MEVIHFVEDGNFSLMPEITRDDIRRAYEIYGVPPAYVRGRETKRHVSQAMMCCRVEKESDIELGFALQGQLDLLRIRGFIPVVVHTDPQSAFKALTATFPGMVIDVGGVGNYIGKVDAKIRHIKDVYRGVNTDLP
jgi:hypothetical protein